MLQALVNKGKVLVENVPAPNVSDNSLLIKTVYSCISAGTELGSVKNSGVPLIKRALQQPDNVKKVLEKVKTQGLKKTYSKIKGQVEVEKPIGYSLSGVVVGVGKGVSGFKIGNRVSASGAGIANHAEYVDVPVNLVTKLPDSISYKEASTVTLGAIAMQGVRRADLKIGELAVVFGCGIIGLIALQILKASGVRVVAIDIDDSRLNLAGELGAELVINPLKENIVDTVDVWSEGYGVDAVLFTAATPSNEPLSDSFKMCRKKGRVVLVGVSGMNIKRSDIYPKELDFLISTSYGPGRYDDNYEIKGVDYPYAYVRWTENRNFKEYLRLIETKQIQIEPLISKIYNIEEANKAYDSLKPKENKPLIVLLNYGELKNQNNLLAINKSIHIKSSNYNKGKDIFNFAIVGAGSFATNMHLPNLMELKDKFRLHTVCSSTGSTTLNVGKQFGAKVITTDFNEVINNPEIDLIIITTRHDSHGKLVLQALQAGKNVMVEKPLAVKQNDVDLIKQFYVKPGTNKPVLFVGFNRRFSKYAQEIKKHTSNRANPLFIRYRMNAGYIPKDSWVHENGGRIVGEACHIIDLMTFFTESTVENINIESLEFTNEKYLSEDNKTITLKYKDGSVCSIDYFAVGNKAFPKEYMEVHFDGKTIVMEDYKKLKGYGIKIKEFEEKFSQKGHKEELIELYKTLKGENKNWPIKLWDMVQTTEITFMIMNHN